MGEHLWFDFSLVLGDERKERLPYKSFLFRTTLELDLASKKKRFIG